MCEFAEHFSCIQLGPAGRAQGPPLRHDQGFCAILVFCNKPLFFCPRGQKTLKKSPEWTMYGHGSLWYTGRKSSIQAVDRRKRQPGTPEEFPFWHGSNGKGGQPFTLPLHNPPMCVEALPHRFFCNLHTDHFLHDSFICNFSAGRIKMICYTIS